MSVPRRNLVMYSPAQNAVVPLEGGAFWDTVKNVNRWLRDNKAISRTANALSSVGVPYADRVGSVAGKLGYGYGGGDVHIHNYGSAKPRKRQSGGAKGSRAAPRSSTAQRKKPGPKKRKTRK